MQKGNECSNQLFHMVESLLHRVITISGFAGRACATVRFALDHISPGRFLGSLLSWSVLPYLTARCLVPGFERSQGDGMLSSSVMRDLEDVLVNGFGSFQKRKRHINISRFGR